MKLPADWRAAIDSLCGDAKPFAESCFRSVELAWSHPDDVTSGEGTEEMGRYWDSQGLRVGWEGEKFDRLKELARRFSETASLKGKVCEGFVLNEMFQWLRETLESRRNDALTDRIAKRRARKSRSAKSGFRYTDVFGTGFDDRRRGIHSSH